MTDAVKLEPCPFCGGSLTRARVSAFHPDNDCWLATAGEDGSAYEINDDELPSWNRRADPVPPPDWAQAFDAQKSIIGFLVDTLKQIKRDNEHYNFGGKLIRIVDAAIARAPGLFDEAGKQLRSEPKANEPHTP